MDAFGIIPLDGTALSEQNPLMGFALNSGVLALDSYVGLSGVPNAINSQVVFTPELELLLTSTTKLESDFTGSVIPFSSSTANTFASVDLLTGLAEGVASVGDVSFLKDGEFIALATTDLLQPPSTAFNQSVSITEPIEVGIVDVGIKVVELNQSFDETVLEPTGKAKATTAEVPTILANSDPSTADITTLNVAATLDLAVATAKEQLKLFVNESEFIDQMKRAFGDDWEPQQANALIQDLVSGKDMPEIKVLPFAQLKANGAFGEGTIYLKSEFLSENVANPEVVALVLLEEIGHYLDQKLNSVDSPGDEGNIFARFVQGETIGEAALGALKAENDSATILLNGQEITVELAQPSYPGYLFKYESGKSLTFDKNVKEWQQRIKDRGWDIDVDGFYGQQSKSIARQFQQAKDLPIDGIVGLQTWKATFDTSTPPFPGYLFKYDSGKVLTFDKNVKQWQQGMKNQGWDIDVDGFYGQQSKSIARQFQQKEGLVVDGIVGVQTWEATFDTDAQAPPPPSSPPSPPPTTGSTSYDAIEIINSNAVDPSIRKYAQESVPLILNKAKESGITDPGQIAYILASADHESLLGKFMEEIASGEDYEGREDLGNTQPGDGPRFKGRGYVQITGRNNYKDWSQKLGIDLVSNPDLAAKPDVAATILVLGMRDGNFTSKKLSDYINRDNRDFVNARRIVNGDIQKNGSMIAQDAERYYKVLTT